MLRAAQALEAVRSAFAERRTGLRGLVALDDQIGLAESRRLRTVLTELRTELFRAVRDEVLEDLRSLFDAGTPTAPCEWLQTYAAALSFWRLELCRDLTREPFDLGGSLPPIDEFARWTDAMLQDRWICAESVFHELARHKEVDQEMRADFLAVAAENRLYNHGDEEGCWDLLEKARELAPDSRLLPVVAGEYWLDRNEPDLDRARAEFERAREADPRSDAWWLIGDIHRREQRIDEAEYAYRDAMTHQAGETTPYARLLGLYDDPERLAAQETILHKFVQRAATADQIYAHRIYVAMGDAYERCGRYELAYEWYEKAINANPSAPSPLESRGYALANEGRFDEAESAFRRSIELAPEAFEGRWGLGWVYERAERYQEAIATYEECLGVRPKWAVRIRARIAAAERELGHLDAARDALLKLLREAPNDASVLEELHEVVDELAEVRDNPKAARGLLSTIRKIRGDAYESDYQNRLGVISYASDDYERAAGEFRRSIDANPEVAVVHRNLFDALRALGDLEGAREALERSSELDQDETSYHAALGLIENDQGNRLYEEGEFERACEHYERAAELRPEDDVIHSNVALAWLSIWRPAERRLAVLAAENALRRAVSLNPDHEEHQVQLEVVEFERRLLDHYASEPAADGLERVIGVSLASDLVTRLLVPGTMELNETTTTVIRLVRERLRAQTGLTAPAFRFSADEDLTDGYYSLDVVERVVAFGYARSDARLFAGDKSDLERLRVEFTEALDPRTDGSAWWVDERDWSRVEGAGLELWEVVEYPLRHLETILAGVLMESLSASPHLPDQTA